MHVYQMQLVAFANQVKDVVLGGLSKAVEVFLEI